MSRPAGRLVFSCPEWRITSSFALSPLGAERVGESAPWAVITLSRLSNASDGTLQESIEKLGPRLVQVVEGLLHLWT